ncbi:MAG: hypothetical protein JXA66_04855, partial [Oligoflexia bacterium]|nr:hypothetical protein [Oligoflexia bacterium]
MISFHTFGCKCNLYDSEQIASSLAFCFDIREGELVAGIHVINTCTVTSSADAQARNLIRKLNRLNSGSLIYIIGCSSRKFSREYGELVKEEESKGNNSFEIIDNLSVSLADIILKKACRTSDTPEKTVKPVFR